MKIVNSTIVDIPTILNLYEIATNFQRAKNQTTWPVFETELLENEIAENQQWKLLIEDEIACVWATTFTDPQIWEEKNSDPSVYIHRIATNPKFRGQKLVQQLVEWAKKFAASNQKQYIRMDTAGKNEGLIKYYASVGFEFLGIHKLKNTDQLPSHYHDADICFFQINLKADEI